MRGNAGSEGGHGGVGRNLRGRKPEQELWEKNAEEGSDGGKRRRGVQG